MKLNKINLSNFRNYSSCRIEDFNTVNLFLGDNGSGKTNLLDAIHYACFGRSYFSSSDRKVLKWEQTFFRLEAEIELNDEKYSVVAKVVPGEKKEIEINGKKLNRISELVGKFPIIAVAPKEIYALLLASEARRKIIDQVISQYDKDYFSKLLSYNAVLLRRNAMLKQAERIEHLDPVLLDSFNQQLTLHGSKIYLKRKEFLDALRPIFESYYQKICLEKEQCSISYKSQLEDMDLSDLLRDNVEKDFQLRRTSVGTHKDDISFTINNNPLNAFGSQGQLKSFIIALKLALYTKLKEQASQSPILLLDDIFDKFDEKRTSALMALIFDQSFGQVFISDANKTRMPDLIKPIGLAYNNYHIESGKIV